MMAAWNQKNEKLARRQERATEIAADPSAIRQSEAGYLVQSQTYEEVQYHTTLESCECTDWQTRHPGGGCKHMRALALRLAQQRRPADSTRPPDRVRVEMSKEELRARALQDLADIWGR